MLIHLNLFLLRVFLIYFYGSMNFLALLNTHSESLYDQFNYWFMLFFNKIIPTRFILVVLSVIGVCIVSLISIFYDMTWPFVGWIYYLLHWLFITYLLIFEYILTYKDKIPRRFQRNRKLKSSSILVLPFDVAIFMTRNIVSIPPVLMGYL